MIDLHLHLDGSLTAKDILELASKQKIPLPADSEQALEKLLMAPQSGGSLNDLNCPCLFCRRKRRFMTVYTGWPAGFQGRGYAMRKYGLPRSFIYAGA